MASVPPPGWPKQSLSEYQRDIHQWHYYNFGDNEETPPPIVALALQEEGSEVIEALTTLVVGNLLNKAIGKIARVAVKDFNKIRGTHEEWMEELDKELGDAFILLCEVATRYDRSLCDAVWMRWCEIYQRDWRTNRVGHGLPESGGTE